MAGLLDLPHHVLANCTKSLAHPHTSSPPTFMQQACLGSKSIPHALQETCTTSLQNIARYLTRISMASEVANGVNQPTRLAKRTHTHTHKRYRNTYPGTTRLHVHRAAAYNAWVSKRSGAGPAPKHALPVLQAHAMQDTVAHTVCPPCQGQLSQIRCKPKDHAVPRCICHIKALLHQVVLAS